MAQIVLIGVSKSSVAAAVSERTGRRNVPLDAVRWFYYYRLGYDHLEERRRVQEGGFLARFAYWKPYEVYAVERVLADFADAIIDFGAGHSVHDDEELFARVEAALSGDTTNWPFGDVRNWPASRAERRVWMTEETTRTLPWTVGLRRDEMLEPDDVSAMLS